MTYDGPRLAPGTPLGLKKDSDLRDRFAMAALPALIQVFDNATVQDVDKLREDMNALRAEDVIAVVAYEYADAMMRARERTAD